VVTLFGERAGHDLMLRLAERLGIAAGAIVYRTGDRTLALPWNMVDEEGADALAGLRALLTQPVEILGRRVDAAVHIGIAEAGEDVTDRLIEATRAAGDAAAHGVFRHDSAVDVAAMERRLVLMGELDQAIAAGEIEVHYQPKLGIASNRIASVEALVRWRHPTRGFIAPDAFIPLAEQSDRIAPLTLFVIDRTIRDLAQWRAEGLDLTAAVNVSATLIASPAFADAVATILAEGRVPADRLIFEVTESATLADPERAATMLRQFRAQGIGISMDDYGTGQSTLSYLRQLPLTELKIDRSFVRHAHRSRPDALMVRSTIALAHDLGLKVVAEGIEEEDCLTFLREAGCDMAQGYLISRPLPADRLTMLLTYPERALSATGTA
jgi:EAL domain-containing protein (putative c-di-GMP-specific phosphodiesterase class I)